MPAMDPATLDRWRILAIVDRDGSTVGAISEFYLDRETRYPTWALVNTGLFGTRQIFVPLLQVTEIGDGLQVPYEKGQIKDAPRIDLHGELSPDEEAVLFAHYGIDYQPAPAEPGVAEPGVAGPGFATAEPEVPEMAAAEPGAYPEPEPTPDERAADGPAHAEGDDRGQVPVTDELAWPTSPPPPGPITEPPTEPPQATGVDRDR